VAHGFEVINMLDGDALDRIVAKHKPDCPWDEAIRTERFTITKTRNYCSSFCKAANFTMNRKAIRDLASKELGLKQPTTAMQLLPPSYDKESKPWECLAW
jgi:phosphoribosylglycinamide formyltransferase 2